MSNEQKYPLVVLDNLKEIKKFLIVNKIKAYKFHNNLEGVILEIYNKDLTFYFTIQNFEIQRNEITYTVIRLPFNETSIGPVSSGVSSSNLSLEIAHWWGLVKRYTDYEDIFEDFLEVKHTTKTVINKPNNLSVCLKQIQIRNYYAIKSAEIIDIPEEAQWVFLIGENGYGKTLLLQSIFIGLFGTTDNNTILAKDNDFKVLVEFNDGSNKNIVKNTDLFDSVVESSDYGFNKIVAIGASRLNLTSVSANDEENKSISSYSLFNTDGLLLNIDIELYKLAIKKDKKFEAFRKSLVDLLNPYLSDIIYDDELDKIFYFEKDAENEEYNPVKYDNLASGFKSIIGIAGDIIIRLSKNQDVKNIKDLEGIVLIDEFDLHWHPKLQINVPKVFARVFPKIQFIVSTHSPLPLLGAPLSSKVYKVNRSKDKGVTVESVELNLKKLTPNLILTSPVFDMDSIVNINVENLNDVDLEDNFNDIDKNKKVDIIISNMENIETKYPDSLFK